MTIAAIRYNNPGNVSLPIQGWHGGGQIVGISGQSGYASFPDMQTGYAAFQQRVSNYIDVKGLNTISQLNTRYAEDPNWGAGVSRISGIGLNTPLDTSNSAQMNALSAGIIQQETGRSAASLGIDTGATFSGYVDANGNPVSDATLGGYPDFSRWGAIQQDAGTAIKSSSQTTSYGGSDSIPKAIDNQSRTMAADTKATNAALAGLAGTLSANTQLAAQNSQNLVDKTLSSVKNLFSRSAFIIVGIILLLGAVYLLSQRYVQAGDSYA